MLKFIGAPKRVEIRYIRVDGSAMVDMEKENVKEIAKSLREGGVILHPSLVDKASKKIVCGRDRILAQMRNDMKTALVQYVTGSELDLARAMVEENLCRRSDDKGVLRTKLKAALAVPLAHEDILGHDVSTIAPVVKRGRPSEGKASADAELAKHDGVKAGSVRKSISRAKKKIEAGTKEPDPETIPEDPETPDDDRETPEERKPVPAPKVSCLKQTLGLEVPELIEDSACAEQKRVDRMAGALREFGAALTDHRKEMAGLNAADDKTFEDWENQRGSMASAIRRSRPASLCPHCKPHVHEGKLFAELTPTCAACRGTGYISEEKIDGIEKALLAEGDDAGVWVATEGKRPQWRTLIQLRGEDF